MAILIDMGALTTGGGATLGLNFLKAVLENNIIHKKDYVLIAPGQGPIRQFVDENVERINVFIQPESYGPRALFEFFKVKALISQFSVKLSFTFLGVGLPVSSGVISVVSFANTTLCYDESSFWNNLTLRYYLRLKLITLLRKRRLKAADHLIVETEVVKTRLSRTLKIDLEKITVKPPAPSIFIGQSTVFADSKRILFLCKPYAHKNIWRLPSVALSLKQKGHSDFRFIISCTEAEYLESLEILKNKTGIERAFFKSKEMFNFIGSVSPKNLQAVYDEAFAVALLSDLESFSNNYLESWIAGRPLIVSDRDFSHHICENAALYCEPHNPESVADVIINLFENKKLQSALVSNGKVRLTSLQNTRDRAREILDYVMQLSEKT